MADGRLIEGYACLFGVVDLGRDMVLPGAFRESLSRRGAGGVRLLYQHDPAEPIGVWREIAEDARGLYVRGRLSAGVARARECAALIEEGALDGLSIGFKAVEARADPRSRVRRISRIDLWEVSIVTFPMQPGARVALGAPDPATAADPAVPARALREAAARLRQATRTPVTI
jgi:HK97 family phage prohead protease